MYNNQSLDERIQGSVCSNDNYNYNTNEISGNRYFMKWSPQEDMKFYSKSRYGSPRMLSKSVPKKNKNLARCRINRSLNFDAGLTKSDLKFKSSPNTSLDSICCDDEKQLSRSAKIMKALNFGSFGSGGGIDGSPISTIGKKKVNKTLNFNFSPSPKRLSYYNNRSPCNIVHLNLSTSSPKIGKSLNFEASPAESNISSILGTSIDSIDENQNQTPSERRRSVKKSLKYHNHHTPQRKTNNHPFDFIDKSPLLRSELREKIDNIIKISTPNKQTLKKTHKKSPFIKEIFVSTPRNLYNDFDDVASSGPRTPKNRIQLIPQSMSAIKKSHKKERFPRLAEADEQLAEKLDISNEQRPLTPPIEETTKTSIFDVNSIKRSHKKDKSQKSPFNRQEDESLDGSIFSYSEIDNFCNNDDDDNDNNKQNFIDKKQENLKISKNTILTPTKLNYDNDSNSQEISKKNDEISISPKNETRPSTPINRIDLLERVIGSSIKKSHKKLKDENKKRILAKNHENSESKIEASTSNTEQRSTTPENINSSRLLLPMFSSVKKSHKKDKRSKILSNFARRQKIFSYDREKISSTFSTSTNSIVDDDNNDDDDDDVDLLKNNSYDNFDNQLLLLKSSPSPQKRKLSNASNLEDEFHPLSMNDSNSIDYKSSNEEFQIFTPIKKKKSAPNRKFTDNELNSQSNLPLNRCETPIIDQSEIIDDQFIITPEKNESSKNKKEKMKKRKINQQKLTPKRNEKSEKKVTPKNNKSALELMGNINSVKKSHKKEKKGNRYSFKNETIENFQIETPLKEISTDLLNVSNFLTPESSLHSININNSNNNNNNNSTSETSFKNISQMATKFLQTYEEYDGSKPSTSYEINNDKEIVVKKKSKPLITTTPPNLLKTKKYLKSQQSESIKKSHKKKREEFKNSLIIQDHELSDDGSIFTKEDRMNDDDFSTDRAINKKKNTGTIPKKLNRTSIVINMNESHLFNEKKVRSTRRSSRLIRNMSNDGSLFGSDEEGH